MAQIGRQVLYGAGIGADVAPTYWFNQLSFDLAPKTEYATNNSAYGQLERTNDSTPIRKWAEGELEAKLTPENAGIVLGAAFGSIVTTDNADANAAVKDHTMTLTQDVAGKLLTLVAKDELTTEKYTSARIGEWSLNFNLDDYLTFTAATMARTGVATTATAALPVDPVEFVPKHFSVKTATTVAGLAGATNLSNLESFTLTVNPNIEADWYAGSDSPAGFTSRGYDISFEMQCRYTDTVFREAFRNGTALALQLSVVNTDATIGTAARPGLVITAPKFHITDWAFDGDLDSARSQTMTGTIHFSAADAYALRAVLTNTTASYA